MAQKESVGDLMAYVFGPSWGRDRRVFDWPPYSFLAAALLLKRSGAYRRVLEEWPPKGNSKAWDKALKSLGHQWRMSSDVALRTGRRSKPPARVKVLWRMIRTHAGTLIDAIAADEVFSAALVELLAAADESAEALGLAVASAGQRAKYFARQGDIFLNTKASLTPDVAPSLGAVLPKQHTPSTGITLRSMSHHLAFHAGADSRARWWQFAHNYGSHFNILLAPWPLRLRPNQFRPAADRRSKMVEKFRSFDFESQPDITTLTSWLKGLLTKATAECGRVDLVVLPEAALTPREFYAANTIAELHGSLLLSGVMSLREGAPAANQVWLKPTVPPHVRPFHVVQDKHHRWLLTGKQVEMYGLGGSLDPSFDWWENTAVESRYVNFIEFHRDMTMCCLVCEDLARQEPVAELVRAVGPNLVIALLSDAPQLKARWPGRYATVLADDPGCSVLTLTSLGMAQLSKPPPGKSRSRSIALWKDFTGDVEEIDLPANSEGAILNLRAAKQTEWTADGRSDRGAASFPRLVGMHYI